MTVPALSNSLADLAARINVEHQAAQENLRSGLKRAIAAGELLIEAKRLLPHGKWLPWLEANCTVSERTAQAYMRVARSYGELPDSKSATVADLSFRDALNQLAVTGGIAKRLPAESLNRAIQRVEDDATDWRHAVRQVRREDVMSRHSFEAPQALLPSPKGRRKISVARNPTQRQWMLAIGPNVSRATLQQREEAARAHEDVVELQRRHDGMLQFAADLEAEAGRLREGARTVAREISTEVKDVIERKYGRQLPFTETYDFQADETTDAEIAALSDEQRVERLLAARNIGDGPLRGIERGYWGDVSLMGRHPINPGPAGGNGWTRLGSPEWLGEMFPRWNEPPEDA
jgi:Protein of unknown function (DUF3102)